MSEGGRRFCENCGTEIGQTTNFCPNCGAAQRPTADVPTGPPPPIPEPGRIGTPATFGVPPAPGQPEQRTGCLTRIGNVTIVLVVIIVILVVLSAVLRACAGGGGGTGSGGSTTDSGSKAKEEAKSTGDSSPHFSDGTQQVGSDIQAGTYRTRKGSSGCYYARLSGFSGGFEDILANDNADGPAVVTIDPTDAGFQSSRCGTWTQDLSAITDSTTSFEDGTYIVGTDIEPGTYKNSGSSGCYYARLSGFSGPTADLIANEVTDGPAVVEIAPTDVGFESKRCGTWSKIS